jgi:hypothetical protein
LRPDGKGVTIVAMDQRQQLRHDVNRALRGTLDDQLRSRRERGDTYTDIQFWLFQRTKRRVSDETVRSWCQRALAEAVE